MKLYKALANYIKALSTDGISGDRKEVLQKLIEYLKAKKASKQPINLNFICTHNSRRSHLSQVWAQTMAHYFHINHVTCYSGGTEATALFPMVAETLENTGFKVKTLSEGNNPIYSIKYAENEHPIIGYSKKYDDDFNPKSEFAAIMCCSQADTACPMITGAEERIPITFKDPKAFDNTPQQGEKYMERNHQIATEMFYIFSQIK